MMSSTLQKLNNWVARMRDYDTCVRNYEARKMNNKNVIVTLLDITHMEANQDDP